MCFPVIVVLVLNQGAVLRAGTLIEYESSYALVTLIVNGLAPTRTN